MMNKDVHQKYIGRMKEMAMDIENYVSGSCAARSGENEDSNRHDLHVELPPQLPKRGRKKSNKRLRSAHEPAFDVYINV
jgi:hypothetical protein